MNTNAKCISTDNSTVSSPTSFQDMSVCVWGWPGSPDVGGRKQEAFEQEVTQASVRRHALPTPNSFYSPVFMYDKGTHNDRVITHTHTHTLWSLHKHTALSILFFSFSSLIQINMNPSLVHSPSASGQQ